MVTVRNVTGFKRNIFNLRLKISIFFHYLTVLGKGELSLKEFILVLRRLLLFVSRMKQNKFVEIEGKTRLGLYIPGFPSTAFLTACRKFSQFEEKMPCTTVLLSITSACPYHCQYCYQKLDKGKEVDIEVLVGIVRKLQEMGVAFFNIEGGEPFFAYERLKQVCQAIDSRSEIWINSTGAGMTKERLAELRGLNVTAVMFSLHSPDAKLFNKFMGKDSAWETMKAGVEMCHEAGLAVAFNTCLLREDFYNGTFEGIMEAAKDFKACLIQIIKPKPAGGWLEKGVVEFTPQDIEYVKGKVNQYNLHKKKADYPAISAQIIEENKTVFGCTAGGTDRFYINAKGDLQPCEFLNISFGNIMKDKFEDIYAKMRTCFDWGGESYLCESCSQDIHRLYEENGLDTLPLTPELSEKIYGSWERGKKTDLYERLERMRQISHHRYP
ncbi:radical SAM/SPASM domain-containing protein [Desulfosporosinus hippei]|uniref:Radical SAM additional 4Fe4S-binding SPASM domain-containing protein n=1 Tax=Desulfosporosinus hippei DSM 8344 TaxID=1121419 RepID=A0A1G7YLW6_9FIRM|nr:radical SAM protein [Desulfosporosinus hippei]SDG97229.1 radical SAM additional 4Fe4S-binding SPASM domain-containing protein [Desulfosporosinus hippei DSM 8344]